MKKSLLALLPALLLILGGCSSEKAPEYHTMFEGTLTQSPAQTVIVTVPTTVIVTVYRDETAPGPGDITTSVPGDVTTAPGTGTEPVVTTTPETTAEPTEPDLISTKIIGSETDLGSKGSAKAKMILRYPELSGMKSESIQTKVNTLLSQIADVRCRNFINGVDDFLSSGISVTLDVTSCEVTFINSSIMSVKSSGKVSYSDSRADVNFMYCNIINLSTGKDIALKNIYCSTGADGKNVLTFGQIIDLFTNGQFTAVSADKNINTKAKRQEIISQYSDYADYATYPQTYFTGDSLCICIDVGSEYGDWAIYSIPLSTVSPLLKISPLS